MALLQEVLPGMLDGKVVRTLRTGSDQPEYYGLIQKSANGDKADEGQPPVYTYGVSSLADKQEVLRRGDSVRFQLAVTRTGTGKRYPVKLASAKRYVHSRVESVKGQVSNGSEMFIFSSWLV